MYKNLITSLLIASLTLPITPAIAKHQSCEETIEIRLRDVKFLNTLSEEQRRKGILFDFRHEGRLPTRADVKCIVEGVRKGTDGKYEIFPYGPREGLYGIRERTPSLIEQTL